MSQYLEEPPSGCHGSESRLGGLPGPAFGLPSQGSAALSAVGYAAGLGSTATASAGVLLAHRHCGGDFHAIGITLLGNTPYSPA